MTKEVICEGPDCDISFTPNAWNHKYHNSKCKRQGETEQKQSQYLENLEEALIIEETDKEKPSGSTPKVLLLDIETSPNLVYTWGLWNQNIGLNQIEEVSRVLCFSAKWLHAPKKDIMFFSEYDDSHEMIKIAWELLNEADAVIHYNGNSFDMPHLNREFLESNLGPPSVYQNIDLYSAIKRFKFQSRKLDHVSQRLGLDGKVAHEGFDLWRKCLNGDEKAWKKMERYNKQDVLLLEDLYQIMLPWLKVHPNQKLFNAEASCPRCGSSKVQRRGITRTSTAAFQQYHCQECRGWFKDSCGIVSARVKTVSSV